MPSVLSINDIDDNSESVSASYTISNNIGASNYIDESGYNSSNKEKHNKESRDYPMK